ncbi:MAG: hypothetical protein ACK6CE_12215, partial [Planctomycetota bacterium]
SCSGQLLGFVPSSPPPSGSSSELSFVGRTSGALATAPLEVRSAFLRLCGFALSTLAKQANLVQLGPPC